MLPSLAPGIRPPPIARRRRLAGSRVWPSPRPIGARRGRRAEPTARENPPLCLRRTRVAHRAAQPHGHRPWLGHVSDGASGASAPPAPAARLTLLDRDVAQI